MTVTLELDMRRDAAAPDGDHWQRMEQFKDRLLAQGFQCEEHWDNATLTYHATFTKRPQPCSTGSPPNTP